jgi:hypothetical protein
MSVTLNEAALRFLLEDEQGPVGLDLVRRSENVVRIAREHEIVNGRLKNSFPDIQSIIDYEISVGDQGLQSSIGPDGKSWASRVLVEKDGGKVFKDALDIGLDL